MTAKHFSVPVFLIALIVILLFCVTAQVCTGAEPLHATISDPVSRPIEVYTMTSAEFFQWATDQNKQAKAEWDKWYKSESKPRWLSYGFITNFERSRRGRGSNYGLSHRQGSYFGYSSKRGSSRSYAKRYLNPDYTSRPLMIINPFCLPAFEEK